jgi:broad specificity phosphatase PhoE
MTVTTRWWWIRHDKVHNPEHRLYGQSDIKAIISDAGPYKRLAPSLPPDALWLSSHLSRTRETASALRPHMDALGHNPPDVLVFPEIAEQDFGTWQGMNLPEIKAHLGDRFDAFWRAPAEAQPPEGESFAQVVARVTDAVERITREHAGRDIIAFAHGGSIRAALAMALDLAPGRALSFNIRNLSLTRIDHLIPGENPRSGLRHPWQVHQVNHLHPEDD